MAMQARLVAHVAHVHLQRLEARAPDADDGYFHRLVTFHEDMHGEAFAWLRATLGWPAPAG